MKLAFKYFEFAEAAIKIVALKYKKK